MILKPANRILPALCGLIFLTLLPLNSDAVIMIGGEKAVENPISIPSNITPGQVGDFVAPLSEQQVRELLISKLETQAQTNADISANQSISVIELLKGAGDRDTPLGSGIHATIDAIDTYWLEVNKVFEQLVPGQGFGGFLKLLGILLIVIVAARAIEWICLYKWRPSAMPNIGADNAAAQNNAGSAFITFFKNLVGLFLFMIAGYLIADIVTSGNDAQLAFINRLFDTILVFRFFCFVFKLILNPSPQGLSLIDNRVSHRALYRSLACFTFAYVFGSGLINLFIAQGLPTEHYVLAFMFLFGLVVNPIVFWFVWTQRYDVDQILFGSIGNYNNSLDNASYPYAARAAVWPAVVIFVINLAFINWQIQALMGNMERQVAIEIAWWVTLLFPFVDLLVASLLYKLTTMDFFQTTGFKQRKYRVTYFIRSVIRFFMLAILTISFLEAWGFQPLEKLSSTSGASIISSTIDIGVTIMLGFIIWEAIQLAMERHLPEIPEEETDEIEGEGGGVAATRSETLLPLFRTILLLILSSIVIMSVLYSLGVQIGPLLAGASVVGIAIGFGSQKLVQDIISGMFFLIDDAFRRGEYVEVAGLKGTIEKLSMRSMRLRHHLGAVQTIPYGEINTVKNLSRDWVTMKLELRLPYDVDIEKVRKIIKKVGQKMIESEETGPSMLAPLKSQGVMRVEESALIFRMKFTAKPGEQWVVRRVAYTNTRNALAEAGIEFAHREIKVRMPAELEALQKRDYENKNRESTSPSQSVVSNQPVNQLATIASAAGMTAVLASELAKHGKLDEENDNGSDEQ